MAILSNGRFAQYWNLVTWVGIIATCFGAFVALFYGLVPLLLLWIALALLVLLTLPPLALVARLSARWRAHGSGLRRLTAGAASIPWTLLVVFAIGSSRFVTQPWSPEPSGLLVATLVLALIVAWLMPGDTQEAAA